MVAPSKPGKGADKKTAAHSGSKKRPASAAAGPGLFQVKRQKDSEEEEEEQQGEQQEQQPHAQKDKQTKLTSHDKKAAIREKKTALNANFGIIQDAVPIWEVLRQHQTSAEEKTRLIDQVLKKVKDKLLELARHHTASRILQFCVMYGTDAQKKLLLDQVKADFLPLSKSKHGRHLVQKLISQAKKEEVPSLVALCKGHAKELLRHPQGADVMIDLYDVASTQLRNAMCAEFYGREFSLFDGLSAKGSSLSSLTQLLEGADNAKRRSVLLHMTQALMPIVEKGILHPPMVHRLLKDFFDCAPSASVEDVLDTLSASGTTVLKMVHTHEGAAVACMMLAYGSAKDRKRLIKAMKGTVDKMATNEWGFTVLCTAVTVVDDTSLVSKIIVAELKAMLEDAIEDPHASRVLLQLLSPDNRRYLSPSVMQMMHPPQRTVVGTSGKMVTDIEGDEDETGQGNGFEVSGADSDADGDDFMQLKQPKGEQAKGKKGGKKGDKGGAKAKKDDDEDEDAGGKEALPPGGKRVLGLSKKDELLRRKELLGPAGSSSSLAAALTSTVAARMGGCLRTSLAADVVVEVARGGAQGLLAELAPEGVASVHSALIAEVAADPTGSSSSNGSSSKGKGGKKGKAVEEEGEEVGAVGPQGEHVCTHYFASRAIRRLLLAGSEPGAGGESARQLAQAMWSGALQGKCKRWVGSHAEKVLAALLHCGCAKVAKEASAELAPLLKESPADWSARFVKQEGTAKGKAKAQGKKQQPEVQKTPGTQGKGQQQQQQQRQQQQQPPKTPGTAGRGKKRVTEDAAVTQQRVEQQETQGPVDQGEQVHQQQQTPAAAKSTGKKANAAAGGKAGSKSAAVTPMPAKGTDQGGGKGSSNSTVKKKRKLSLSS